MAEGQAIVRLHHQADWKKLKEAAESTYEKAHNGSKLIDKTHYCVVKVGPPFADANPDIYLMGVDVVRAFRSASGQAGHEFHGAISIKPWVYYRDGAVHPPNVNSKILTEKKAPANTRSTTAPATMKREKKERRKTPFESLPQSLADLPSQGFQIYRINGLHLYKKINATCEKHGMNLSDFDARVGTYKNDRDETFTMIIAKDLKKADKLAAVAKDLESTGHMLKQKEAGNYRLEYVKTVPRA